MIKGGVLLGAEESGTRLLAAEILKSSGVTEQNSTFVAADWTDAASLDGEEAITLN